MPTWVAEILEEAVNYMSPIIVVEAFDVNARLEHLLSVLSLEYLVFKHRSELQKIYEDSSRRVLEALKRFLGGRYPVAIRINIVTPRYILRRTTKLLAEGTEPKVELEKPVLEPLPFQPPMPVHLQKCAEKFAKEVIEEKISKNLSGLMTDPGSVRANLPVDFWIITGLSTSSDARSGLDMLIKILTYDPYYFLIKTNTFVILIDVAVPVSTELLASGLVVYRKVYSSREEVEAKVRVFAEFFEQRYRRRVSPDLQNLLVENLAGLPLTAVEAVLARLLTTGRIDVTEIAQAKAEAVASVFPYLRTVKLRGGFETVGGYEPIKRLLRKRFIEVIRNPEKATRYGLKPGRGVLLFGPPGTGKTTIAKALAYELGLPTFTMSAEVYSHWYGMTEKNIERMCDILDKAAPDVFLLDECDKLFTKRGSPQEHETTRRMKNQLLEWLAEPDRRTIVLATTNLIDELDEAFLRPERLELIIPVPYPDAQSRVEIIKVHLRDVKVPVELTESDLEWIAEKTAFWTGDELRQLVQLAKQEAFMENADALRKKHFEAALEKMRVPVDLRRHDAEKLRRQTEQFVRDKELLDMVEQQIALIEAGVTQAAESLTRLASRFS